MNIRMHAGVVRKKGSVRDTVGGDRERARRTARDTERKMGCGDKRC